MDATWLPSIVAGLALGVIFFYIKSAKKDISEDVGEMKNKMKEYITERDHILMCENQTLKEKEYFNKELSDLKDEIFKRLRYIEKAIKNLNGEKYDD